MRSRRLMLAPLLASLVAASVLTPATAQAAPEQLRLADLDKGPAPTVPYVVDRELHDGSLTVRLPRGASRFLGKAGDDYVVQGYDQKDAVELRRPGERRRVRAPRWWRDVSLSDATLSPDGASFVASDAGTDLRTTLRRYDAATGAVTLKHKLDGLRHASSTTTADRAVVGGFGPVGTCAVERHHRQGHARLARGRATEADIAADRLARLHQGPLPGRLHGRVAHCPTPEPDAVALVRGGRRGVLPRRLPHRHDPHPERRARPQPVHAAQDHRPQARRSTTRPTTSAGSGSRTVAHVLAETYAKTKGAIVRCDADGCERATKVMAHEAPLRAAR